MVVLGEATDGQTAVTSASSNPPALMLLDVTLPGMSGLEGCAPSSTFNHAQASSSLPKKKMKRIWPNESDTGTNQGEEEQGMSTEIGYQHILIPLDGSPESEAIFPYIVPIALQFHSRVTLIEVLTTAQSLVLSTSDLTGGAGVVDPTPILEADKEAADSYLKLASQRLGGMGVTVEIRDPEGIPASTIFELAKDLHGGSHCDGDTRAQWSSKTHLWEHGRRGFAEHAVPASSRTD